MMRALVMDFANDKNALDLNDEFMFGKSLLVSPVTKPMYWKNQTQGSDSVKVEDFSTIKTKEVYLPAGANWFDFWTNEQFTGGQKSRKRFR
jgi:alpha-D-xyloside xylohydrolase